MAFVLDILKDTVRVAEERDKESVETSARLEDKSQKTVTLAGLFLAAAFGFLKPDATNPPLNTLGVYGGITLIVTIVLFLLCLGACLSVMWVRGVPQPLAVSTLNEMNRDLSCLPPAEITEQLQENYYKDLLAIWGPILEDQRAINKAKARRLLFAQILLGFGMLSVAVLLFWLVFNSVAVGPKL